MGRKGSDQAGESPRSALNREREGRARGLKRNGDAHFMNKATRKVKEVSRMQGDVKDKGSKDFTWKVGRRVSGEVGPRLWCIHAPVLGALRLQD
eukprot:scaffold268359_cov40-Tisochrysis_lutea.AAC.1